MSITFLITKCLIFLRIVPDLTFSEVAFLNPRRPKPDSVEQRAPERKRRRKDKAIDAEEEMSRFFTAQNTAPRGDIVRSERNRITTFTTLPTVKDHPNNVTEPRTASSNPPIELPDRPFLGFGSSGVSLTSPIKVVVDHHDKRGKDSPRKRQSVEASSIDSSSYYTWSESPTTKVNHPKVNATPIQVQHDAREKPEEQPPAFTHCPSSSGETIEGKTPRVAGINPKIRRKRSKTRTLTPNAALPDGINAATEAQAEEASQDTLTARRDTSSLAEIPEGGSRNPAGSRDVHKEERTPYEVDSPHQMQPSRSEQESRTRNDLPLRFDEALESLLGACKVPLQKHKNAADTPSVCDNAKEVHRLEKSLNNHTQPQDAGSFDQSHVLTPNSLVPHEKSVNRDPDRDSPRSIFGTNIAYTPASLPAYCGAEDSTTFSRSRELHKTPTQVLNRPSLASSSDVRPPWLFHRNEHFNESQISLPSESWHGYQSIYQNQVLPDDNVDGYNSYASNPGEFWGQGGETRSPQLHNFAEPSESRGPHDLDRRGLAYIEGDLEDNRDSYELDIPGLGLSSNAIYNASHQPQLLDYDNPAADPKENIYTPNSAFAGVEQIGTNNDSLHSRMYRHWPAYVIPAGQDRCGNRPGNRQQRVYDDPSKEYLTGFWRPNKLY